MTNFPERVKDARLLVGVTQEELSRSSGVQQSLISMIERGERNLTDSTTEAIAAALALPLSFFTRPTSTIPDNAIDFRKLKKASSKETDRAKVLFKEAHRTAVQLMEQANYPAPTLPVVQDREYPLPKERIEAIAADLRQHLQLDLQAPISNVTRSLERRGIAVVPLVIPGADDDPLSASNHFGASHWSSVHEPAVVTYFPGSSGDRDRFTIAHELAHIALHTFRQHVPLDEREIEANDLASAFLLPAQQAIESMSEAMTLRSLAHLKARWGISMQALIMRAARLEIIDDARRTSLFRQISARGWRKQEPVAVPHETPILLRTLLERHYGPNPFSVKSLDKDLGLPLGVLSSLAPAYRAIDQTTNPGNVRHVQFGNRA